MEDSFPTPHKSKIEKANDKWLERASKKKYVKGYKQRNLDWMPNYPTNKKKDDAAKKSREGP